MPDKPINEMNADELRQLRSTLAPDHDPAEVQGLNDLIVKVSINEGIAAGIAGERTRLDANRLDEEAYSRWGALKDKDSTFYKAVMDELEARGDSETNKRALSDASNKVAMDLGMVHDGFSPNEATMNKIKGPGSRNNFGEESTTGEGNQFQQDMRAHLEKTGLLNKDNEASATRMDNALGGSE